MIEVDNAVKLIGHLYYQVNELAVTIDSLRRDKQSLLEENKLVNVELTHLKNSIRQITNNING